MKTNLLLIALVLISALLIAGCAPKARVGALQTESQSVELGDAKSVRVEINFGAGELEVSGGSEKLLEAGFTYNVARLKPELEYTDGTLAVRQPETSGLPALRNITDFRNEWDLRLNDDVPIDLTVNMGGGGSDMKLADLSLTRLDVKLGAGTSTIDLNGDWASDLYIIIDAGAANLNLRLPRDIGVRVEVDRGPTVIEAPDLAKNGNVYTNAAYGESEVTLQLDLTTGIGWTTLNIAEEAAATSD